MCILLRRTDSLNHFNRINRIVQMVGIHVGIAFTFAIEPVTAQREEKNFQSET